MGKSKWNKETVEKEAKKYSIKNDFRRKSSGAFKYAYRNNLLKNFTWFVKKPIPMWHWNKENCEKESHKYKTRSEFKEKSSGAYEAARKNGWLNDYIWLENKNVLKDKIDTIYGYFFNDGTVYIGRTLNLIERDKCHRKGYKNDSVYKYANFLGVEIPPVSVIESGLSIDEGKKREQYWIDYYKNKKNNILNKQKGGGIGSLTFRKYTKEKIISEAKKYKTRKEFREKSPNFYYHAWKNGILQIIPSIQTVKRGTWQNRKNVEKKSKEFKTLKEFSTKSKGAYDAAQKGGYLNELIWLKRERKIYKKKNG